MTRPDWWDPEAEAEGYEHDERPTAREAENDRRLDAEESDPHLLLAQRYLDRVTQPIVLTAEDEERLAALLHDHINRQDPT